MTAHCSSCGSTDREDLETGDQGYTACCNKSVCHGGNDRHRFGTPRRFVRACCWGRAEAEFTAAGHEVPDGASRLD